MPLSLVGTFGAMYLLGYSLDNLSMMALTISTGFVVDDAIVMIENISRYIEEGDPPLQAALKGAEQIGFTILSLTVSLIAVLIPLLFMGDVVGRLFREFAVTLAVTIIISAVVSLTLTPMMCARMLQHTPNEQQGRFYRASERAFERMIAFYGRTLKVRAALPDGHAAGRAGHAGADGLSLHRHPQGLLPGAGHGRHPGHLAGAADDRLAGHGGEAAGAGEGDPGRSGRGEPVLVHRRGRHEHDAEQRADVDQPEAARPARPQRVGRDSPAGAEAGSKVQGIQLFMQPVQNITVDDRVSRTQYQYTLEDPDPNELNLWTNRFVERLKQLPELEDVATDQQTGGLAVSLVIDRVTASRLGIAPSTIDNTLYDAFGQRQINTMYTQLNQYHVILEAQPQFQQDPSKLSTCTSRPTRRPGATGRRSFHVLRGLRLVVRGSNALTSSRRCYTPASGDADPSRRTRCRRRVARRRAARARRAPAPRRATRCRSAPSTHFENTTAAAFDQSPGTVPFGHRLVQPGAERLAGRRHLPRSTRCRKR